MTPGDTVRVFDTDQGVIRSRLDGNRYEVQLRDGHGAVLVAHEKFLTVISPATARRTDPDTSHEAAARQTPDHVRDMYRKVLNALRDHPAGLNDFELADVVHVQQASIGVRRGELTKPERGSLVEYAGVKRPSPSGSPSMVWRLSDAGWRHVNRAGAA
jgi:hypothetical protein